LESGPLSEVLDAKAVREAAEPFLRVLVRVPEAYPLLGPYEASRPGLLVLDADGRRVDARALKAGDDPAVLAAWLKAALTAPPRERWVLRGKVAAAEALKKVDGVLSVEVKEDVITVLAKTGAQLTARAADLEILEPATVTLTRGEGASPLEARHGVMLTAGVWSLKEQEGSLTAYVTPFLLDPAALAKAAPGWTLDVESRRYAIPKAPTGPPGMRIANAVSPLPGVLAVFPALADETVTVVGRKSPAPWPEVLKALRAVLPEAAEKP
jgi:hypothetical protein